MNIFTYYLHATRNPFLHLFQKYNIYINRCFIFYFRMEQEDSDATLSDGSDLNLDSEADEVAELNRSKRREVERGTSAWNNTNVEFALRRSMVNISFCLLGACRSEFPDHKMK